MNRNQESRLSHSLLERFARVLLNHRCKILIGLLGLTLLAGIQAVRAPIGTSFLQWVIGNQAEYETYRARAAEFGGDSDDLVYVATVEGDELFSRDTFNAIRRLADSLESETEIARVYCLPNVRRVPPARRLGVRELVARTAARKKLARGSLRLSKSQSRLPRYWPLDAKRQQQTSLGDLKREMLNDEHVMGVFLSRDGSAQGMVIELNSARELEVGTQLALRRKIESRLREHGLARNGAYFSGVVIAQGWMFEQMQFALLWITPIGYLVIGAIVYLLFQRLALVLIAALVALMAILLSLGTTVALFGEVTLLVAAAPLVILVISTSDVIHITAAYQRELMRQPDRRVALMTAVRDVGGACLLTSATTFVGFVALLMSPSPTMRHFAVASAMGVAGALLLAMTVAPIALSFMKPLVVSERTGLVALANTAVERFVDGCRRLSLQRPWLVIVASFVLLALNVILLDSIKVSADFSRRFPASHELRQSLAFFNTQMLGSTNVEVYLQGTGGVTSSPEFQRSLAEFEARLLRQPEVTSVRSPLTFYRLVHRLIGYESSDGLPETSASVANTLVIVEQLDADNLKQFVDLDRDAVRLFVQLNTTGFLEVEPVAEAIASAARREFPDGVEIDVTGTYPICGQIVRRIVVSQFQGFIICCVAIWLIMAIGLKSLSASLVAQFSNLMPVLGLFGLLVVTQPSIDTEMLILPIVAIAIAADDTIHFLHRYRIESSRGRDRRTALDRTYQYTGRAIVQTTLILCIGFLPAAASPYLTIWMLGTYLVATLLLAVVADLLLLPALIRVGWIKLVTQ